MPLSRYPNGFNEGVLLREHLHVDAVPGKIFYVGNNAALLVGERSASDANDGSFLKPFATLDYAVGKCVANRGDVIFIRPNHTETIDAADDIDFDVAGISVIGLGNGSNRPRFDYTAGAGEVAIGADNVLIQNINFHANVDSVLIALDVEDGVDQAVIRGCLFDVETAGTDEFDNAIRFTNNNTNCIVEDNDFDMGIADAVRAIFLDADTQGMIIRNNRIRGDYSTACIGGDTALSTDILIENNLLINGEAGDIGTVECIELLTGTHGVIRDNHLVCNVATPDLAIVADTCFQFNNYYSETVNAEAVLVNERPLVDSANNPIGVDDSNNAFASTNVAGNRDGSILERLEQIQADLTDDSATNVFGVDDADNGFSSSNVVANVDGSILERLEALMDPLGGYDPVLGFRVTKTSNLADGSGTDDLFTVTGRCLITHLSGEVTTQLATSTTMKLRDTTNSVDLCAATTITGDVVGTMYALPGLSAEVLNGTGGTPVVGSVPNVTTPAGDARQIIGDVQAPLTISHVLDGAGTGAVAWVLYYKPLTAASSIVAAA